MGRLSLLSRGSEDSSGVPERGLDDLGTPLTPDVIKRAESEVASEHLRESDRDLTELLEMVQQNIKNHSYLEKTGNAFFDALVSEFNDPRSLRRPVLVRDRELFFIVLAEGWAHLTDQLDMTRAEAKAVRDAHHLYAEEAGIIEYPTQVNVIVVGLRENQLRDLIDRLDFAEETLRSTDRADREIQL